MKYARHGAAFLAVLGLLLAACGSDDDGDGDAATETAETPAETAETPAETAETPADDTEAPTETTPAEDDASSAGGPEGTLRVGFAAIGPIQNYPPFAPPPAQYFVTSTIYESLIGFSTQVEPSLVESWSVSEDNLTWTFNLRRGVQFQNGWGEMTSEDVIFSLNSHMVEGAANQAGGFFAQEVGLAEGGSFRAIDDYTIEVTTANPSFSLLFRLSTPPRPAVISKAYIESVGIEEATVNGVGTGPWQWEEGRSNEFVRYRAVEDHWRNTPSFEFLELLEIPEPATLVANFQAGQVDAFTIGTFGASPLTFDEIATLRDVEGAVIETFNNAAQVYFDFHGMLNVASTGRTPADQPWVSQEADTTSEEWANAAAVRKAMSISIDRQSLIDNLLLGQGTIPHTWVTTPYGGVPSIDWGEFDPDKARQLLADAGYADGFTIPMALPSAFAGNPNNIGTAVCPMWEQELNITCEIENAEMADFRNMAWVERRYEGITPHPSGLVLDPLAYTVNTHSRGALNFSGEHPQTDAIVERIETLFTLEERIEAAFEWQQWLFDNTMVIPVANTPGFAAFGPNVEPWEFDQQEAGFFYLSRYDLAQPKG